MAVMIYQAALAFGAGILMGLFYFGGLRWTVRRLPRVRKPVVWVSGSFLVRTVLSLAGFYVASQGKWKGMMLCLFGFVLVRMVWTAKVKAGLGRRAAIIRER